MEETKMTAKQGCTDCHSQAKEEERYSNILSTYTSCIVFKGKPILPPVMTPLMRSEMRQYKEMAIRIEKRHVTNSTGRNSKQSEFKIDVDSPSYLESSRLVRSCTPSFASTDLIKYMNLSNEQEESSLWDDSFDEELEVQTPTNLDIFVDKTARIDHDDDHITEMQDNSESSEASSPLTVTENVKEDEIECVSPVRRGSYTLEQPSPALVAYFRSLKIQSETSDDQEADELPSNINNNNKYESLESESVFTNLFTLHQKDIGVDNIETLNKNYQHRLDELIKRHDDALEKLKQSFFQAASNLVSETKDNQAEIDELLNDVPEANIQPMISANLSPSNDLHMSRIKDQSSELPYHSVIQRTEKHQMKPNFDRVSAAVKGYLTRRLFRTVKVQTIVKTIKDTLEFAFELHSVSPLTDDNVTPQDAELHERLIAQLSSACYEIHDIFFKITTRERMSIIAQDRALLEEKCLREMSLAQSIETQQRHRKLSSATLKTLDRRRRRNDGRNSASPRAGRIMKSKVSRDSPTLKGLYRRNLESELRAYSASPQLSYIYTEQRPRSSVSEIISTNPSFRRSLDYKQPIIRKVKTKQQVTKRPFIV
ncbi:hypothetical protein CHUAL_007862 [Chamberlinius hualienensis]